MHTEAHKQGVIPNGVRDLSQNDGSRFLFSVLQASWVRSFTTFRMTAFKICRFKKTLFAPPLMKNGPLVRSSNGKVQVSRLCADRFYVAALETSGFAQRRLDCFNAATDFFEKRNMRDRWWEGG